MENSGSKPITSLNTDAIPAPSDTDLVDLAGHHREVPARKPSCLRLGPSTRAGDAQADARQFSRRIESKRARLLW